MMVKFSMFYDLQIIHMSLIWWARLDMHDVNCVCIWMYISWSYKLFLQLCFLSTFFIMCTLFFSAVCCAIFQITFSTYQYANPWQGSYDKLQYLSIIVHSNLCPDTMAQQNVMLCSALSIYRSLFSPNNSRKTPVRTRYACLPWVPSLTKVLPSNLLCCLQYRVILYHDI